MYIETSSFPWGPTHSLGDMFDLAYACPQGDQVQLDWWYHMYGGTIGTLRLKSGDGSILWTKDGDQNNTWQYGSASVPASSFVFEGVRGSDYTGDIALGDVLITCLTSAPPAPPVTGCTLQQVVSCVPPPAGGCDQQEFNLCAIVRACNTYNVYGDRGKSDGVCMCFEDVSQGSVYEGCALFSSRSINLLNGRPPMLTLLSDHDSACACDCAMPSGVLAERLARDDRLASAPPVYYFDSHVTAPSSFKQSSLPWPPPSSGRPSLPSPLPSLQVQSIAPNTDFPQYSWSSISLALWICFVAFYGSYSQGRNRRSAGHVSRRLGPLMVLTCRQYRCMRQKRCRQCMLVLLLCSLSSLSAQSVENSSEIEETDQLTTFSDSPVGSVEVTHQPAVGTSSRVLQEDTPDARLQLDYPESNNDLTEASIESLFGYSSKIR